MPPVSAQTGAVKRPDPQKYQSRSSITYTRKVSCEQDMFTATILRATKQYHGSLLTTKMATMVVVFGFVLFRGHDNLFPFQSTLKLRPQQDLLSR